MARSAPIDPGAGFRLRASLVSLVVGTAILAAKWMAYRLTGSTAIFSDAMESIVNIVAALFAVGSIAFAARPADRNHPYGHGKIEFISAAFEGAITFAALLIIFEGVRDLLEGPELGRIDIGLAITVGAGVANLLLGQFLLRSGRRHSSLTLIADGKHVLSDFWTTVGVVAGLGLVRLTDLTWFDPAAAIVVALNLLWTGARLVREAAGGLLDEEDTALLRRLLEAVNLSRGTEIISVHGVRAIRSGRVTHVDAHLVVPEFWTVEKAHEAANAFEERVVRASEIEGGIIFHIDPCWRVYCARCALADCPIRREPLRARPPLTLEEMVSEPPPPEVT